MHGMGVRRLRQVLNYLATRCVGASGGGLGALDGMLGDAPELLECYRPPDVFDLRIELYEVEHHQALLFPVRRMTADLAAYLAGRDGGVQQFTLKLEHEGIAHTDVEVGLSAEAGSRRCCSSSREADWSARRSPTQ